MKTLFLSALLLICLAGKAPSQVLKGGQVLISRPATASVIRHGNTNAIPIRWIELAWQEQQFTNQTYRAVERCTNLSEGKWEFYRGIPCNAANIMLIDPTDKQQCYYRLGELFQVIKPVNTN